jgi:hypothetical protein
MRGWLIILCLGILAGLLWATTQASQVRSVFDNGHLLRDPWFVATLVDAYAGFLLFWTWVAWREASIPNAILWFVALMTLGNMAAAAYLLWRLYRTRGTGPAGLLLRDTPSNLP